MAIDGIIDGSAIIAELQQWSDDGLIPEWDVITMQDDVLADVLRAIRTHIQNQAAHTSGFGPRY